MLRSTINLNGPKSREILAQCTGATLENASFRWLSAQQIDVAGHGLWAFRMSYSGELGWEFHGPRAAIESAYDAIWAAGEQLGLTDYGSFAMNAMRMKNGFKGAGELTNEVTLPEADVMRFVKLEKDYLSVEATSASAGADLKWVCAYLEIELDGVEDGHGGEAVLLDNKVVGSAASVAFGHTCGKTLAFAYVMPHAANPGTDLKVVIAGNPRAARVLGEPVHDPASKRPRMDSQ